MINSGQELLVAVSGALSAILGAAIAGNLAIKFRTWIFHREKAKKEPAALTVTAFKSATMNIITFDSSETTYSDTDKFNAGLEVVRLGHESALLLNQH